MFYFLKRLQFKICTKIYNLLELIWNNKYEDELTYKTWGKVLLLFLIHLPVYISEFISNHVSFGPPFSHASVKK